MHCNEQFKATNTTAMSPGWNWRNIDNLTLSSFLFSFQITKVIHSHAPADSMTSPVQSRSPEFDARFRPVIPLTMHFVQVEYHIEFADFVVCLRRLRRESGNTNRFARAGEFDCCPNHRLSEESKPVLQCAHPSCRRLKGWARTVRVASARSRPQGYDPQVPGIRRMIKRVPFAQVSSVNRNSKKGAPLPRLTKIVAIQIHHLVPCRHEVLHKHLLRIVASIGFRDGPEVGV